MAGEEFDLLFVADARFSGGTSTALAAEIEAAWRAGFSAGLLHVHGPVLQRAYAFHPAVRAAVDAGKVRLVDPRSPMAARLTIVHHPMLFPKPLGRRIDLKTEHAVLVAHHPPVDGAGVVEYDVRRQLDSLGETFGFEAQVAPVGPNVRARFDPAANVRFTPSDWHNLIDAAAWRAPFRPFGKPLVIGRHSRPDPLKWPDRREDILAAWPDDAAWRVRVLGGGAYLDGLIGPLPSNWEVLPFGAVEPKAFLRTLQAYVYFHSDRWVEAFGYCVLEALASGLPTVLPESFRPLFGEAALYGSPAQTRDLLQGLAQSEQAQRRQRERGLQFTRERFSLEQFPRRLKTLYGLTPRRRLWPGRRASASRTEQTVLFVSSNGVGLGHITRQMAIARRLAPWIKPVFFTLSRGAGLVRDAGYLVEHTPFHRYLKSTPERWNPVFAKELAEAIRFYAPAALVFDGNVPYAGLVDAMKTAPAMRRIWIRRGMWRDHQGAILSRAARFDAVIEPADLAGEHDEGPTRALRSNVLAVDPILMIRPEERLARGRARKDLGIKRGRLAISLQLGSGTNFDFSAMREKLIGRLLERPEVDIFELRSPLAETTDPEPLSPRHRILRLYPAFRYSLAFDAAVCAAGYNSFHENVVGAIPTLFVANQAEEMDRQDLRALYAEQHGLGWALLDESELEAKAAMLLDAKVRARVRRRAGELTTGDGARQAALFIEETLIAAR